MSWPENTTQKITKSYESYRAAAEGGSKPLNVDHISQLSWWLWSRVGELLKRNKRQQSGVTCTEPITTPRLIPKPNCSFTLSQDYNLNWSVWNCRVTTNEAIYLTDTFVPCKECACMLHHVSHVQLPMTLWAVTLQASLSLGFSGQEYWSGLPCPPPGDLPDPGIEPASPVSPVLQADSLLLSHWGSTKKVTLLAWNNHFVYDLLVPTSLCL